MKNSLRIFALIIGLVTLFITSANAGGNSTAVISGTGNGSNVTLPAPFNETVFAGTLTGTINNTATKFFCVDIGHWLAFNENYTDVSQTDSLMTYVLNNFYPYKSFPYAGSLSDVNKEAAAVQLVMWNLSDNLNISGCTNIDESIKTRALAILAEARANAHTFSLNTFMISVVPGQYLTGNPVQFTVQAFNAAGIAMPNVTITLSATNGTLSSTTVTTGVTGVSPLVTFTPSNNQVTSANVTATGVVGIPSGTKYFHQADPNGKQKLILATPVTASRTITKTLSWFVPLVLSVNKTSDKSVVNHNDVITYTITARNMGSTNAQHVTVSDQLQNILQYQSSVPAGQYNPTTGIWTIGDLNAGETKTLTITCKVVYTTPGAMTLDLGVAKDYNLFVLDTIVCPSSDVEGKLAVGGYADLRGYSVGDKLAANSGDVLVVGNHLTFITGRVYNGRAVYKNFITSTTGFTADDGIVRDSVINFGVAKLALQDLSSQLGTLAKTDTVKYTWNHIELIGHDPVRNVFEVDGSLFTSANNTTIDVPAGSTAIVNVKGNNMWLHGGFEVLGTTKDKVVLNFPEATNITVSGIDVRAAFLAPYAKLNFPAGLITGQVVVRSMYGSGQFNLSPFTGKILKDTSIVNFGSLATADAGGMPYVILQLIQCGRSVSFNAPSPSSVETGSTSEPKEYKLEQNYPNPFNPSTQISFSLKQSETVSLKVYSVTGQEVASLVEGTMEAGSHSVTFNANNLPSGLYIYRITTPSFTSVKKMILMK